MLHPWLGSQKGEGNPWFPSPFCNPSSLLASGLRFFTKKLPGHAANALLRVSSSCGLRPHWCFLLLFRVDARASRYFQGAPRGMGTDGIGTGAALCRWSLVRASPWRAPAASGTKLHALISAAPKKRTTFAVAGRRTLKVAARSGDCAAAFHRHKLFFRNAMPFLWPSSILPAKCVGRVRG